MDTPDAPTPDPQDPNHPDADGLPSDDTSPGTSTDDASTGRDEYADAEDAGKGELVVYSLGGIVDEFTTSGFRNLNSLLLIAFQFNPLILGLITALKTIWDGVMDPIVAHISDNANTRFGRRRPFILLGGIMMAVVAWATWQFMPENDKLRPNDPVVPEAYFADELWQDFAEMHLAYGVEDYDIELEAAPAPETGNQGNGIPGALLETLSEDSIKSLSGDSKAIVRLAENREENGSDKASEMTHYQATFTPVAATAPIEAGPEGESPIPAEYAFRVALEGGNLTEPVTTTARITLQPEPVAGQERDEPVLERMLYFFIGAPEDAGGLVRTDAMETALTLRQHRADERGLKAGLQLALMELLARAEGLPVWRILPENSAFSDAAKPAIRERADQRLAEEPDYFEKLLISEGVTLDLGRETRTADEEAAIRDYLADYPDRSRSAIAEELFQNIDIEYAAGVHATLRDPRGTREFKGIWEKIGDGLKAYTAADGGQERKFVWFITAMFLLMAMAQTVYAAPYYAQGIEIAPSYNGRTLVVAYRSVTNTLINFLTQLFLPLSLMPIFLNSQQGSLYLTYVLSPIGIILAIWVFLGTKERTVVIRSKDDKNTGFFTAVRQIGVNIEFWRICGMYIFIGYAIGSFQGLGQFLSVYYVFEGNLIAGTSYGAIIGMISTVVAFLTIPLSVYLCNRFGKHNALRLALGCLALASAVKYFCYDPEIPELMFIPALLYSPAISVFYKVLSAMMGDVTDHDELRHGERREGMFGAVMAIIMKTLGAFGALAAGLIIVLSGFEQAKGMHQDPGVFNTMLILYSIVPGIAACGGFLLLYRFKLTSEKVAEIKKQLAVQRRQKAEANA